MYDAVHSDSTYEELKHTSIPLLQGCLQIQTLPMRNWNQYPYNQLPLILWRFRLYLWGIETSLHCVLIAYVKINSDSTYEELKHGIANLNVKGWDDSDSTYEELKPTLSLAATLANLDSDSTYEELKQVNTQSLPVKSVTIQTLPMRNWNIKIFKRHANTVCHSDSTYEELKLLFRTISI